MSQMLAALPNGAAALRARTKRIARKLFDRSAEAWRATIHRPGTRRPGNGERLFCAQPFERFEVLGGGGDRGETYFCCQNWVTRSIGNMSESSVEKVWNGRAAQEFRRSILDGSFRYCRTELCPYLQRVDGPVPDADGLLRPLEEGGGLKRLHERPFIFALQKIIEDPHRRHFVVIDDHQTADGDSRLGVVPVQDR